MDRRGAPVAAIERIARDRGAATPAADRVIANSVASAREVGGKLPKDLHWSEEIALVFRLPDTKDAPP